MQDPKNQGHFQCTDGGSSHTGILDALIGHYKAGKEIQKRLLSGQYAV